MPRSTRATRTLRIAVLSLSAAPTRRPSPLCHAGTGVASRRASRRRAGKRREGRLVGGQVRVAEEGEAYQREHPRVWRAEARDRRGGVARIPVGVGRLAGAGAPPHRRRRPRQAPARLAPPLPPPPAGGTRRVAPPPGGREKGRGRGAAGVRG